MADLEDRMLASMSQGKLTRRAGERQASTDGEAVGGKVRITLDLSRPQHRALRMWVGDQGVRIADVFRAVIADLEDDGPIARELAQRLRAASTA
jgi:hypothetical protein